ncbi:MnmC family methyltransferase, partial [Streptococcus mutans]|uniref:MnmC family methyltransferase n=1 Tax=Streptococcus mutans TaxID=1309 RepID=UPI003BF532D3
MAGPGSTISTFTSTGWVRRLLNAAGFKMKRTPGIGHKWEILRGTFLGWPEDAAPAATVKPWFARPPAFTGERRALVIGAGFFAVDADKFPQALINGFENFLPGFALFNFAIDAVFDKNLLQRSVVPLLPQLLLPNFQLALQQPHGGFGALAQHVLHAHKARLVIDDDAGVG